MSKREFIDRLRAALNGRVSPNLVADNVNYYEDYINTEIQKGRTEREVLDSLGDPRLIAKTIVETNGQDMAGTYQSDYDNGSPYRDADTREEYGSPYTRQPDKGTGGVRIPGWVWTLLVILVVVFIFMAIFSVLAFLAPIIIPIIVVVFLVKLFRDWLN